jgi:hypothetical protein
VSKRKENEFVMPFVVSYLGLFGEIFQILLIQIVHIWNNTADLNSNVLFLLKLTLEIQCDT